jgi:hypothetical protein
MAQAFSRRRLATDARARFQARPCEICGVHWLSPVTIIPRMLHTLRLLLQVAVSRTDERTYRKAALFGKSRSIG